MAKVLFNIPLKAHSARKITLEQRLGTVHWLKVGDRKVKFVFQDGNDLLVHFASGRIFGSIYKLQVEHMCRYGHNARLSNRHAAEQLIANVISMYGLEKVLSILDAAKVINP
jgi:hypothetical protein